MCSHFCDGVYSHAYCCKHLLEHPFQHTFEAIVNNNANALMNALLQILVNDTAIFLMYTDIKITGATRALVSKNTRQDH